MTLKKKIVAKGEGTFERDSSSAAGNEGQGGMELHQSNWFCYKTKLAEAKKQ